MPLNSQGFVDTELPAPQPQGLAISSSGKTPTGPSANRPSRTSWFTSASTKRAEWIMAGSQSSRGGEHNRRNGGPDIYVFRPSQPCGGYTTWLGMVHHQAASAPTAARSKPTRPSSPSPPTSRCRPPIEGGPGKRAGKGRPPKLRRQERVCSPGCYFACGARYMKMLERSSGPLVRPWWTRSTTLWSAFSFWVRPAKSFALARG